MTHHLHSNAVVLVHRRATRPAPGVGAPGGAGRGECAVTAVRPLSSASAEVPGPTPRRVRPPRWLDLRLVLGVLLVLGSVLVGARVVTAADATVPVWSARSDLADRQSVR